MTDEIIKDNQEPSPEEKNRATNWAKVGIFFSTLGLIIFIFGFGYGYYALSKVNIMLANMISSTEKRTNEMDRNVQELKATVTQLKEDVQKSQSFTAQQEKIASDLQAVQQGNLSKWNVALAEYLVNLANDQIIFTNNIPLAQQLLAQATQILQNVQDAKLGEINSSLAADVATLKNIPDVDINSIYLRLNDIDQQIDQLPLPLNPLQEKSKTEASASISPELPWWKAGWERTKQALSKIVIVRYHGANELPLILPDEKVFLYQNIHAQLARAMWALEGRNQKIYELSLEQAINWIKKYFVADATETKAMLSQLEDLKKINIHPEVKPLTNTLQLFKNYFATNETNEVKGTATQAP